MGTKCQFVDEQIDLLWSTVKDVGSILRPCCSMFTAAFPLGHGLEYPLSLRQAFSIPCKMHYV